ncbi:MAG: hypothetical protein U5L10_00565 [Candidatus Moranbacteria bacterium]|nr:hypothetical protein [Candidatus Moranbacteria bacterium]
MNDKNNQNQNENQEQNENKSQKDINYEVRSMESDLKNSEYKKGKYTKEEIEKEKKEEKEDEQEKAKKKAREEQENREKKQQEQEKAKTKSPFLENIQKDENNIFSHSFQSEKDSEEKKSKESFENKTEDQEQEGKEEEKKRQEMVEQRKKAEFEKQKREREETKKKNALQLSQQQASKNPVANKVANTQPPKQKKQPEISQKNSGIGNWLLAALLVVSLAAAGAGFYYYFFVLNGEEQSKVAEKDTSDDKGKNEVSNTEKEVTQEKNGVAQELEQMNIETGIINLEENQDLLSALSGKINQNNGQEDYMYGFKRGQKMLTGAEIANGLNIELQIANNFERGMLYLSRNNDVALVFELKETADTENINNQIMPAEQTLPSKFSAFYSAIDKPVENINRNVVFQKSSLNPNIRYFNFKENLTSHSMDWGIIGEKYLIFSTSKNMTEKALNFAKQ